MPRTAYPLKRRDFSGDITITTASQTDRRGIPHRFEVLDALRGICACGVVFFHFHTTGIITNTDFARGSWMFVDFFFVLSGFVIYASYGERLRSGYSIPRFMGLRLGRVYPMYLLVLAMFFAFELLLVGVPSLSPRPTFEGQTGWDILAMNVSLTQIFGFVDYLGWNGPGWSIAAEVWAYLIMAIVLSVFRKNPWPVVGLLAAASFALLALSGDPWLDRTFVHALPRCIVGFAMGMALYRFGLGQIDWMQGWKATLAELLAIIAVVVMVSQREGMITLLAPFVFLATIWIFAREAGLFSRIMHGRFFALLGVLSYSIYIIHVFVQARFRNVLEVAERFGMLWSVERSADGGQIVGGPDIVPDILALVMLGVVVFSSWVTYRLVEAPARRWSRRLLVGGKKQAAAGGDGG